MLTDLLGLGDAADAVGIDPDDTTETAPLVAMVSAISALIDARCGPVISRAVATCGTTSSSTVVRLASSESEKVFGGLPVGSRVDVGTTADPWSVAANRTVTAVDIPNRTVTLSGEAVSTVDGVTTLRRGRFATVAAMAADPAGVVFAQAARETLRHHWALERGAPSSVYDDAGASFIEPWTLPTRVLGLLANELRPGIA